MHQLQRRRMVGRSCNDLPVKFLQLLKFLIDKRTMVQLVELFKEIYESWIQ
jgi:hypothetical protein